MTTKSTKPEPRRTRRATAPDSAPAENDMPSGALCGPAVARTLTGIAGDITSALNAHEQATARRPYWQTSPCPAWCRADHNADLFFEDRNHWTSSRCVDLTLYEALADRDEERAPGQLFVGVSQHYREAEPEIKLVVPTVESKRSHVVVGELGVRLTVAEARALRDELTAMLAEIDPNGVAR